MRALTRSALLLALLAGVVVVPPALAQDPDPVEVGNIFFEPEALTVDVGDTVTWEWVGGFHNVVSDGCGEGRTTPDGCYTNAAGEVFDSGPGESDATFAFTFDEPGTYEYFCSIHSNPDGTNQNATITVLAAGEEPTEEPTEPPTEEPTETPTEEPTPPPAPPVGEDPVADALAWSSRITTPVDRALIGTTASFADSLASGVAQASGAPLLLTDPDALDERVAAELDRLGVIEVTILGGTAAITQEVEDALAQSYDVTRVSGPTRIHTAIELARLEDPTSRTAVLARAFGEGSAAFADALGAGAFASSQLDPVLLTPTEALDADVAEYLAASSIETVIVAGGTAAISDAVTDAVEALGIDVIRAAGPTRAGTALALFDLIPPPPPIGAPLPETVVVDGQDDLAWASGFAAARHAPGGLLLTLGDVVPGETFLGASQAYDILCGPDLPIGQCDLVEGAASQQVDGALTAELSAANEVPPVDSPASGTATVSQTDVDGVLCYRVAVDGLSGGVTMSHIHTGVAGQNDAVLIGIPLASINGDGGDLIGCVGEVPQADIDTVWADPSGHYVNLHTARHTGGEARGQLMAP